MSRRIVCGSRQARGRVQTPALKPTWLLLVAAAAPIFAGCAGAADHRPSVAPGQLATRPPGRTHLTSDEEVVPLQMASGVPWVQVNIGAAEAPFVIDVGSAGVVLLPRTA